MTITQQASSPSGDLLFNRLAGLARLSASERAILRLIEARPRHSHEADARLLSKGAPIRAPHFIITGWACRVHEMADGRRQILAILLPGDAIGLCNRAQPLSPVSIVALTSMRTVEAPEIAVAWKDRVRVSGLVAALDLAAAEEEKFLMDQIVRLGRQTAYERIAHWFMELHHRLTSRGLTNNNSFPMPMTQDAIADAVGLSVVHVNRTLQKMRSERRIELTRNRLAILDPDELRAAGEFVQPTLSYAQAAMNDDFPPNA